jgi:DNA-binding CsgD family transcriptional regulator
MTMIDGRETGTASWVLADEEGKILAATRNFPTLLRDYPELQEFLRMWHRVWPGSRLGWPKYEREVAGPAGRPALQLKAEPMMLTSYQDGSALSNQLCGMLLHVSPVCSERQETGLLGLTAAELRVAERVAEGETPAAIAADLALSVHTVRSHMKRLFSKARVHNRAGLVRALLQGPDVGRAECAGNSLVARSAGSS